MEPQALAAFIERAKQATRPVTTVLNYQPPSTHKNSVTANGVTTIHVNGMLMKSVPAWMNAQGIEATGYDSLLTELMVAYNDPQVKRIEMIFDSPGGQVAGQIDVADAIAAIGQTKPIKAMIRDMCCSGAYWLASQCGKIMAAENSIIGSIGVYTVFWDMTKLADSLGIKVYVIASGALKGMGVPGSPITEDQITNMQAVVNGMADNFVSAVAKGRGLPKSKVKDLATGGVWITSEAQTLGLIDSVIRNDNSNRYRSQSMADEQELLAAEQRGATNERERIMAIQNAFPGEPEFVAEQIKSGAGLEKAKAAFCDVLTARKTAEEQAKAESEKKAMDDAKAAAEKKAAGAPPVTTSGASGSATTPDFMAAARELAAEKKISMTAAMTKISKEQPELHQAYLNGLQAKTIKK